MLEEKAYGKDLDDLRAKLGLNRPMYIQYVEWLGQVTRGDLGESLWTKPPVLEELARRLPISPALGVLGDRLFAIADRACRSGWLAAIRQDRRAGLLRPQRGDPRAVRPQLRPGDPGERCCRRSGGAGRRRDFVEFAKSPAGHLVQFVLPAVILGVAAAAGIMRPDARDAAGGAAAGLRADRAVEGTAGAGRGARARA